MMRKFLAILFFSLMQIVSYSQSTTENDLEVSSIQSPQLNFNYSQNDSSNLRVVLVNNGPNIIEASDQINFNVSIFNSDTSIFMDVSRFPSGDIAIGSPEIFTLASNIKFDIESNYRICASVKGTQRYPTNTSKDPQACIPFVVGLEKQIIELNKLVFRENFIELEINHSVINSRVRILDLSGKILRSTRLSDSRNQIIQFDPPAKGLYFFQLQTEDGQQLTKKFIVK